MATATAAAPAAPAADAPPKKSKKKLVIILAAVLLLVLAGGGAALWMMKKKAAEAAAAAAEEGDEAAPAEGHAKHDDKHALPVFLPLDPFTVNLADRDAERYAQVGITLEMEDQHAADELKAYMPAVRNNILLVLADKTAADLNAREGKQLLAREIRREALRPLGFELAVEAPAASSAGAADDEAKPKKKAKPAKDAASYPVRAVQFSNFIIQ